MAALAPPIAVAIPPLLVGPDVPVLLDANEPMVLATPCIGWQPTPAVVGVAAQVEAPTCRMLRCFIARCGFAQDPATHAFARNNDLFGFVLTAAAWTRILTELRDSGLFATVYTKLRHLAAALETLVPQNPALLLVPATDVIVMPPFNPAPVIAPAGAGGRGRGRGRGAAVGVPVPPAAAGGGPADLRFIHLASLDRLVDSTSSSPMLAISILAGSLGPCSNQAVRDDELSTVRCTAAMLRINLAKFVGDASLANSPSADPLLASQLRLFVVAAFRSFGQGFRRSHYR